MVNGLTVREIKVSNTRPEKSSRPSKKDRKNIDDATYACIGLFIDSRDNTREEESVAPSVRLRYGAVVLSIPLFYCDGLFS
jgi:hypothetical protein